MAIMKTKNWILIGVAAVIIIGGIIWWSQRGESTDNLQKEIVTKSDLEKTISATGSLVSESPIALNFESAGRVQEIKVKVGDEIIEGDIVAILDNNVLSEQVKKAKAALDKAVMTDKMNSDSTREALEKVDNAENYLEAVEEYYDQLVDAAEIAYENSSDYQEDAESYYDQVVSDYGVGSKEAKSALLTLTSADNSEQAAEEALETARKSRALNNISAENSLSLAEESLTTIESNYAESSRNATVVAAQADYQIALKSLENSSLKAPLNGIISKINYEPGEVIGSASLGESFGEMITKDFILEADIPESDISELELDQTAEVTFDAFEYDEKFIAKIIEIEPASTKIQDVVYYKAKLKIEGSNFKFKEGMSADIDILINSEQNILRVSDQFIFENNGQEIVFVMNNGKLAEKKIKTGLNGDNGYTEILSGLEDGEEVYLKEEK